MDHVGPSGMISCEHKVMVMVTVWAFFPIVAVQSLFNARYTNRWLFLQMVWNKNFFSSLLDRFPCFVTDLWNTERVRCDLYIRDVVLWCHSLKRATKMPKQLKKYKYRHMTWLDDSTVLFNVWYNHYEELMSDELIFKWEMNNHSQTNSLLLHQMNHNLKSFLSNSHWMDELWM